MSGKVDFSGPFLKTERAEHHINQLEAIFAEVVRVSEDAMLRQTNKNPLEGTWGLGGIFARHTPTVLGDAIHNLRAALDHAYCVLVKANGHTVKDRVNFPIHPKGDRASLKGSIDGHIAAEAGPSEEIRDYVVDTLQPYKDGAGVKLISLHALDIADKHMVLLPVAHAAKVDTLVLSSGGSISGISFISHGKPAIAFPEGVTVNQKESKVSFDILFGKGQPFELQPILPILRDLHAHINEVLAQLQARG